MTDKVTNTHIYGAVSRLEGQIEGLVKLMDQQTQSIHRRIDDKVGEVIAHIERHDEQINDLGRLTREAKETAIKAHEAAKDAKASAKKQGTIGGVGAGSLVAVMIELLKAATGH